MNSILIEIINEGRLDNYLNETEKSELIEMVSNIKVKYLYKSPFHGLYHSEKVLLFAYLIGKNEMLSSREMEIITDAAMYHDIGRHNDYEDKIHGYASAMLINKVIGEKSLYQNKHMYNLLQAICDGHSLDDNRRDSLSEVYELPSEFAQVYKNLYNILKDADALDRIRFGKTASCTLKEKFLRIPFSKQLVDFSYDINRAYRDKISEQFFEKYSNHPKGQDIVCYHGIGFNFAAFDSILEHGILSARAKKQHKVDIKRNFNGNNNDLWISVTVGDGEAKKIFVDNGISFECITDYLVHGIENTSRAQSEGFPINSGLYSDELFAFYEIPLSNILSICVNPTYLMQNIDNLSYLNGSRNYDTLVETINTYINYLKTRLNYFPNTNNIEQIMISYRNLVLNFESKNVDEQQQQYQNFFHACDSKVAELNSELQKNISEAFVLKFNKPKVTLYDVINYIILEKGNDFNYQNGKFERIKQILK